MMTVAAGMIFGEFVDAWAAAIWRASWLGAIALALAWAITRTFARLPPALKCWVWRLAYLKLLVALVWAAPIHVPVLPAPPHEAATAAAATPVLIPQASEPDFAPAVPTPARPAAQTLHLSRILLTLWSLGVLVVLVRLAVGWHAARALRRSAQPVEDTDLVEACAALAARYDLRRPPPLAWGATLRTPLLLGPVRPLIVLPLGAAARHSPAELRLMLAHELAHLKRGDLWWNWLPTLAQTLFFFHPFVWLAGREWRLAQESACDEAAVGAAGASPAQYGDMLLGVIAGALVPRPRLFAPPATAAAGVVESPHLVRRRLTAMKHFQVQAQPVRRAPVRRALLIGAVSLAAALSLVPLRLVAREPAARERGERLDVVPEAKPDRAADAPGDNRAKDRADDPANTPRPPAQGRPAVGERQPAEERSFLKAPETDLAAAAEGVVSRVAVEVGQRVKTGELLVELDPDRAAAELQLAKADFQLREAELRHKQELFSQNKAINKGEVMEAEFALVRAQSVLAIKQHELGQTRIVAPFDGVVAKIDVRRGAYLARGGPAVTVVQSDTLWTDVNVPASVVSRLKKGTRAEVTAAGENEKTYAGRVVSISPVVRSGSQTVTVRVKLDETPADLLPGSAVQVRLLPRDQGE